jgi:hypothetical protein
MTAADIANPSRPSADIRQQLRTYHHVLIALRYVVLAHIVVGSFLILAFCTPAGVLGGGFIALVELACGLVLAKDRNHQTWLSEAATLFVSTSVDSGGEFPALADEASSLSVRRLA